MTHPDRVVHVRPLPPTGGTSSLLAGRQTKSIDQYRHDLFGD
ncbi:hypothetical protein SAMN04489727_1713 [Amycolatopsis tolypomycina]|uniref:Uncharacterized protein n=1 Tax=Amycolatopsis tolypomycina TaxID=208445 RepID=A0A1H4JCW0_9PSEU|nr:hypothetical protein [Amycolatopsis tolypomycina]SEB43438.1 hypothetical protein SAMN04489727_1713 [Amycolatopsis tolypomycina]